MIREVYVGGKCLASNLFELRKTVLDGDGGATACAGREIFGGSSPLAARRWLGVRRSLGGVLENGPRTESACVSLSFALYGLPCGVRCSGVTIA